MFPFAKNFLLFSGQPLSAPSCGFQFSIWQKPVSIIFTFCCTQYSSRYFLHIMLMMSSPSHNTGIICLSPPQIYFLSHYMIVKLAICLRLYLKFLHAFDHDELKNKAALFQNSAQAEYPPPIAVIIYVHREDFQQLIHLMIQWFITFHSCSLSSLFYCSSRISFTAFTYCMECASSLVYYPNCLLSIFL